MKSINNPEKSNSDKIIKKQSQIIEKQEKIILEQNEIISAQNETINILKDERDFYKNALEETDKIIDEKLSANDECFKERHIITTSLGSDDIQYQKVCNSLLEADETIIELYKMQSEVFDKKVITLTLCTQRFNESNKLISEDISFLGQDFDLVDVLIEKELLEGNNEKVELLEKEGLYGLDNKSLLELFEDIKDCNDL